MIGLCIEPYCQECPDFEPTVDRVLGYDNKCLVTNVFCENRERCAQLAKHLQKESARSATNDNKCICCGDIIPEGRLVCPSCEVDN